MTRGLLAPVATTVVIAVTMMATTAEIAAPASADPVIAAAGDIACDPDNLKFNLGAGTADGCRQKYTSDLLVGAGLSGVLALGDIQYESGALVKYPLSYDPTWGRVKSITHPAIGNHEYWTLGAAGYFDYFNGVGVRIGIAGDRMGKGYYSFNIGAWHLIALNSNCNDVTGGCAAGSPQEQWLRRDLADNPAACTLAYWHHPLFSSGNNRPGIGSTRPLFRALYDGGADLVLTGHDHNYERFAPQDPNGALNRSRGIRHFIVGTGGKALDPQGTPIANSEVRNHHSFGVLELTLHPSSYEWRFVPAAGSTFTDSGSETCVGAVESQSYPRPKAAEVTSVRLVPAFESCGSPNAAHGEPLAAPACNPAVQSSAHLTVGASVTQGSPADFTGQLTLRVLGESPIDLGNGDQADVKITTRLQNVRKASDYSDYEGELQAQLSLRITDRANGPSLDQSATVTDLPVSFTIPCQPTPADPQTGSACNLESSVDTLLAGTAREGKRSIWEVLRVQVFDGGPDGVASTADNTLFARPGLFAP